MHFSLAFYAEKLKKRQITVLGYKKGSKFDVNNFFESATPKLWVVSFDRFVSK